MSSVAAEQMPYSRRRIFSLEEHFAFMPARRMRLSVQRAERSSSKLFRVESTGHQIGLVEPEHTTLLLPRRGTIEVRTARSGFVARPGETEAAMFVGSTSGDQFEGVLPESGDYRVRVYLMRNAARRDEVANYRLEMIIAADGASGGGTTATRGDVPLAPEDGGPRHWEITGVTGALNLREEASTSARAIARFAPGTVLNNLGCLEAEGRVWCDVQELGGGPRGYVAAEFLTPAISPDGSAHYGEDDSALRAGQGDFDAIGPLPCAQAPGRPMGQCDFGVARGGSGAATVVITRPDGRTRSIYFANGVAIGADTSEADPGAFSAERDGDLTRVRAGDERYEIIDAIVLGG